MSDYENYYDNILLIIIMLNKLNTLLYMTKNSFVWQIVY